MVILSDVKDLSHFTKNLKNYHSTIWIPKVKKDKTLSYPINGHKSCFEIESKSFWFKHRNDCIIAAVKNFPPDGILFDVGGGNGFVTKALNLNGFEAVLVEPNLDGVQNAVTRKIPHIIQATLEEIKFRQETLPAVSLFDVLEHIPNEVEFLKQINNLLRRKGRLYISVPAFNFLWSIQDIYASHFRRYSLKQLKEVLNKTNYKIDYSTYYFSFLPLPIFLFRSIPTFLGLMKNYDSNKFQKEMVPDLGYLGGFFDYLLGKELNIIKQKRGLRFGSSILVVAHKNG